MKTSHELARELLELPDTWIAINEWGDPSFYDIRPEVLEFGMEHTEVVYLLKE